MTELRDDLRVNYFNYFTEIEEHFVRRRGKYLLVSPLDWAALEGWKEMCIPLHVALKGIDRVFDAYEKRPVRSKLINSILYCQQEVLTCFEEYKQAHLGESAAGERSGAVTGSDGEGQFSRASLKRHMEDRADDLRRLSANVSLEHRSYIETLERGRQRLLNLSQEITQSGPVDLESLEMEFTRLERLILDQLKANLGEEEIANLREEGERQLRAYRKRMTKEVYEQTLDNFADKLLRERHGLPRLSLFYL